MFFAVKTESEEVAKLPGMADLAEEMKSMQMHAPILPQALVRWSWNLAKRYALTATEVDKHQQMATSEIWRSVLD